MVVELNLKIIVISNNNKYLLFFTLFLIFNNCIYSQTLESKIDVGYNDFIKLKKIKSFYSYYIDYNTKDTTYSYKYFFTKEGYLKKIKSINEGVFDVEIVYYYDDCYNLIRTDSSSSIGFGYSSSYPIQKNDTIIQEELKKYYKIKDTTLLFYQKNTFIYNLNKNDTMFYDKINDTIIVVDYFYYNDDFQLEKSLSKQFNNQKLIFKTTNYYYYYYENLCLKKIEFFKDETYNAIRQYIYEYY